MTRNRYCYPVDKKSTDRITYRKSPAHVPPLEHSVDFIVPEGTPVMAAADGVVVEVKQDSHLGGHEQKMDEFCNYIEIEHRHGEYSEYEHIGKDGSIVQPGDSVKKGQIIGYSGATGWIAQLGPHLHFMVGRYSKSDDYKTLKITWDFEKKTAKKRKKKLARKKAARKGKKRKIAENRRMRRNKPARHVLRRKAHKEAKKAKRAGMVKKKKAPRARRQKRRR